MCIIFFKCVKKHSNSYNKIVKKNFKCPDTTWRPAASKPGAKSNFFLNIRKLHPKGIFLSNNLNPPCLRRSAKLPPPPPCLTLQHTCLPHFSPETWWYKICWTVWLWALWLWSPRSQPTRTRTIILIIK